MRRLSSSLFAIAVAIGALFCTSHDRLGVAMASATFSPGCYSAIRDVTVNGVFYARGTVVSVAFYNALSPQLQTYFNALAGSSVSCTGTPTPPPATSGVFFGDSITYGFGSTVGACNPTAPSSGTCWADLVSTHFGLTETNKGIIGDRMEHCATAADCSNTVSAIDRYTTDLLPNCTPTANVFLMFGVNDATTVTLGTEPSFTPDTFQSNYTTIVNACVAAGTPATQITIMGATMTNPVWVPLQQPYIKAFNAAAARTALVTGARFVSTADYMAQHNPLSLLNADGVHPNDTGYAAIAAALYASYTTVGFAAAYAASGIDSSANGFETNGPVVSNGLVMIPSGYGVSVEESGGPARIINADLTDLIVQAPVSTGVVRLRNYAGTDLADFNQLSYPVVSFPYAGGGLYLGVNGAGGGNQAFEIHDDSPSAPTPAKYLRVSGGCFGITNNAFTTTLLSVCDAGDVSIARNVIAGGFGLFASGLVAATVLNGQGGYVPPVYTNAGASAASTEHIAHGTCTFSGAASCAVTFSGITWSSATSYECHADEGAGTAQTYDFVVGNHTTTGATIYTTPSTSISATVPYSCEGS